MGRKNKKVYRCGLCDINFKNVEAMRKHFDNDEEHKKRLADPELMVRKILESQQGLLIRDMVKPQKAKGGRR
jgi:hypothetical protein